MLFSFWFGGVFLVFLFVFWSTDCGAELCTESEDLNEYLVYGVQLRHTLRPPFSTLMLTWSQPILEMPRTGHGKSFYQKLWPSCYISCNDLLASSHMLLLSLPWCHMPSKLHDCMTCCCRCSRVLPSGQTCPAEPSWVSVHKFFVTLLQVVLKEVDSVQI